MPFPKIARRHLLQSAGLLLLAGPSHAVAAPHPRKTLVCVCLRGAMDGLSAVVPYSEADYYRARPSIAIPPPGQVNGALPIDGRFGLHPRLAPLLPLYQEQKLALVTAVGSPHPSRSHFEAQDYLETGLPGNALIEGWLNRYLTLAPDHENPLRAIAITATVPRALVGKEPVLTMKSASTFGMRTIKRPDVTLLDDFQQLYTRADDALGAATQRALATARDVRAKVAPEYQAENGAVYPAAGQSLMEVARIIKAGYNVEVAWVNFGAWDTHTGQVGAKSQLAKSFGAFGATLSAFHTDMGTRMKDTLVVTMTEFGRTVRQNGIGGTDHGHGSVMFVLGGDVRGGRTYGQWPGLAQSDLYRGRDVDVTTDFREVLGEIVVHHMQTKDVANVFPNFDYTGKLGLFDRS